MPTRLKTAPAAEPVDLATIKTHLRIGTTDAAEDNLVEDMITAARQMAESFTQRAFISQTWELLLDNFPGSGVARRALVLPYAPLSSVVSIKYIDTAGVEQTLDGSKYVVDADTVPGRINLAYGESWPAVRDQPNAVTVEFIAGYGTTAADVPDLIRQAIKMIVGHMFENREDTAPGNLREIPMNSQWMLNPYKVFGVI